MSTEPVAMTHRIDSLPPGSSFFDMSQFVDAAANAAGSFIIPGAHRMQLTKCPCASSIIFTHLPSWLKSQQRIDLSSLTLSRYFPPGWKSTLRIQLSWPTRVLIRVPLESHNLMVLSREPVATNSPELLAGGGFFTQDNVPKCV